MTTASFLLTDQCYNNLLYSNSLLKHPAFVNVFQQRNIWLYWDAMKALNTRPMIRAISVMIFQFQL